MHSENHGALTFHDKLLQRHLVDETPSGEVLLYVDRQLVYEATSPQAWTKKQGSQNHFGRWAIYATRQGVTSDEHERVKALERENKELRRANEILKLASAFFAQAELDRRLKS